MEVNGIQTRNQACVREEQLSNSLAMTPVDSASILLNIAQSLRHSNFIFNSLRINSNKSTISKATLYGYNSSLLDATYNIYIYGNVGSLVDNDKLMWGKQN